VWIGGNSVKRQTLLLVIIGVVLFLTGGTIAFASVITGTKHQPSGPAATLSAPVAVATGDIAAGTTGESMVAQGLVSLRSIPAKDYVSTDIATLQGLSSQVLNSPVSKGHAIQSTQLTASATAISLPKGKDGATITVAGVAGLAGYLQPGVDVDVYANITKLSANNGAIPVSANVTLPCTELVMSSVEVLDVSSVVPALSQNATSASRAVPSSITILMAVSPPQARLLTFMSENETLSVVQSQKGTQNPPTGACIGTGQTTSAP
jgi:Flp pilus assembly protein CpaB